MFDSLKVTAGFKNSITQALKSGRLSHAIILEGSDDETRFLAAKEIAAALMCQQDNAPCGVCPHCMKCDRLIHPDLHILEKEADSTMIKVDAVRSLKAKALLFPNEAKKSVFIIRQANLMNPQAQNALLKIFEEPASHICFILTCPSKSEFLDTVISRATLYTLGEEIAESDTKNEAAESLAVELINSLVSENEFMFIRRTSAFKKDKKLFAATVSAMLPVVRDALILSSGGRDMISAHGETASRLSRSFTQKKLTELMTALQDIEESFRFAVNHNLAITRLSSVLFSIRSR